MILREIKRLRVDILVVSNKSQRENTVMSISRNSKLQHYVNGHPAWDFIF